MQYAKALVAALIALVGGIAVGYTDDTLTKGEFWAAAAASLVALGGVFQIPNKAEPSEDGASTVEICAILTLIGVVLLLFGVRLG